ncbi:MAG: hypothetical protein WA208_20430 [Thermoanaerobaculia bacterium]
MRNLKIAIGIFACLSLGIISPPPPSVAVQEGGWFCSTFNDRTILNIIGYGDVCGGWGQGCTECFDTGNGDSCVTNGTYCSPKRARHRY